MNFSSRHLWALCAAVAILAATAATRRSSEEGGSEVALRSQLAQARAELVALRAGPSMPEPGLAVEREPALERRVDRGLATEQIVALLRSRNRLEQGRGLKALASLSGRTEKLAVARELFQGTDLSMKSRALLLLGDVRGPEAVGLAVGVLSGEDPSWLRSQAASVLGDLGDAGATAALLEASRAGDLDVRAAASSALDRLGHSAPIRELIGDLSGLLDHRDGGRREDAVLLLSTLRTPAILPAMAKALADPTNSRVREVAADGLGRMRLPEAVPFLETALGDPEPRVRQAVRHALDTLRAR